jgi:small subunit ribosomal protein S9
VNDEQRPDDQPEAIEPDAPELSEDAVVPSAPQPPQTPDEPEAAEQPPAVEEQESPAAAEPPAAQESPAAEEQESPAAEEPPAPVEQESPAAEEPPAAEQAGGAEAPEELEEEYEPTPRERPEIPGADLIPDILPEAEEFMDAEARAAAEAEAEARAAREREERDQEAAQPIADAAIDLAAGARYTATGKRKSAVARVILKPGDGTYAINGKGLENYFPRETLQRVIRQPLEMVGYESRMDVVARMHGGGVAAQAEALRHGISRALIVADPHLRSELKRRGFLTRDPRVKERKKAGLKKARKRPQFSKR